jgi:hypothetical protein
MNTLTLALMVSLLVLSVACASDGDSGGHANQGGAAGQPAAAGGGAEAGAAGAQNEPDDRAEARLALCERICSTEAQLACPPDRAACLQGWCQDPIMPLQVEGCLDQYDALLVCMAEEPVASFECIDKDAFPRETTCVDEQAALANCIQG